MKRKDQKMAWRCSYGVWNCPECKPVYTGPRSAPAAAVAGKVTMLAVPYAQKDQAKALGARWNPAAKKWFIPAGVDVSKFAHWLPAQAAAAVAPAPVARPAAPEPSRAGASFDELMSALAYADSATVASIPACEPVILSNVSGVAARSR